MGGIFLPPVCLRGSSSQYRDRWPHLPKQRTPRLRSAESASISPPRSWGCDPDRYTQGLVSGGMAGVNWTLKTTEPLTAPVVACESTIEVVPPPKATKVPAGMLVAVTSCPLAVPVAEAIVRAVLLLYAVPVSRTQACRAGARCCRGHSGSRVDVLGCGDGVFAAGRRVVGNSTCDPVAVDAGRSGCTGNLEEMPRLDRARCHCHPRWWCCSCLRSCYPSPEK